VLPIARAAAALSLPLVVSEECLTPIADIAAVNDRLALQVRGAGSLDRAFTLAGRAKEAGARAIVVTALAPAHPRPGLFPGGVDIQSMTRVRGLTTIAGTFAPGKVSATPAWGWDTLAEFARGARELGLPIQLKGVLHPADATLALQAGFAGVAVSNLGVRNLYRWAPAVDRLAVVAEAVKGRGSVVLDGGVRSAADVVVAACLGADLATMVRPVVYRAIAGGETAVTSFLSNVLDDIETICFWMGANDFHELGPSHVVRM
jgi:isopentenyl diphosphate isomerase/L-lactate dehydrogenase-like FMN-dependent dehydrogenase